MLYPIEDLLYVEEWYFAVKLKEGSNDALTLEYSGVERPEPELVIGNNVLGFEDWIEAFEEHSRNKTISQSASSNLLSQWPNHLPRVWFKL